MSLVIVAMVIGLILGVFTGLLQALMKPLLNLIWSIIKLPFILLKKIITLPFKRKQSKEIES